VHRGFQMALNQVWEKVHSVVTAYRQGHPEAEISFTGRSLGAAPAVLASVGLAIPIYRSTRSDALASVTGPFAIVLSNRGRRIYRYVNYDDAVAHVGTESLLYRHAPEKCSSALRIYQTRSHQAGMPYGGCAPFLRVLFSSDPGHSEPERSGGIEFGVREILFAAKINILDDRWISCHRIGFPLFSMP
jgi:hypothetical protein